MFVSKAVASAALACALVLSRSSVAVAQDAIVEPAAGTPLRKAVLDALRPAVEKEFKSEVQFVVKQLRVADDWAYVKTVPQHRNGTPFTNAELDKTFGDRPMDGIGTEAVLERVSGQWLLRQHAVGRTDMTFQGWCEMPATKRLIPSC